MRKIIRNKKTIKKSRFPRKFHHKILCLINFYQIKIEKKIISSLSNKNYLDL